MHLVADRSNNNPGDDYRTARAHGLEAVSLKASEGEGFVDRTFRDRAAEARAAGVRVGAYHFATPRRGDWGKQAHLFCGAVGKLGRRDLRPMLDFESNPHSLAPRELVGWARDWNAEVRRQLGVWPLFYSFPAYIVMLHADKPIGAGLILAAFSRNDGSEHPFVVPAPWRRIVAHQFTSNGRLPGIAGQTDLWNALKLRPLLAHPLTGLI